MYSFLLFIDFPVNLPWTEIERDSVFWLGFNLLNMQQHSARLCWTLIGSEILPSLILNTLLMDEFLRWNMYVFLLVYFLKHWGLFYYHIISVLTYVSLCTYTYAYLFVSMFTWVDLIGYAYLNLSKFELVYHSKIYSTKHVFPSVHLNWPKFT